MLGAVKGRNGNKIFKRHFPESEMRSIDVMGGQEKRYQPSYATFQVYLFLVKGKNKHLFTKTINYKIY